MTKKTNFKFFLAFSILQNFFIASEALNCNSKSYIVAEKSSKLDEKCF